MKSSQLAALGGVTVRTLRHYHQVGVLQEPPRGSNGYREYTVHELVRLLRIKRLSALGVSLEAMVAVLDSESDDHADLLDSLDASIDAEIERLETQKQLIRIIRAHGSAPDSPPELHRLLDFFTDAASTESDRRIGREQAVLVAHLLDDAGLRQAAEIYEQFDDPAFRDQMLAISQRFDELDGDPQSSAMRELADEFIAAVRGMTAGMTTDRTALAIDERTALALMLELQSDGLNPAQRAAMDRIGVGLSELADP